jgi:outer membrane lipoprotein-sorting protein
MKKNILTLAALFIALTAFAQNSGESRAILDRAFANYESSNGISLLFTINVTEANGITHQTQSGEAKIKGDKFRLIMSGIDIWFDGATQWVLMRDVDEVSITKPTGNDIAAISPLALLGMYKTGFSLKEPTSKTVNGRNSYLIDMAPAATNNDFREVAIAIDKQTNTIVQVNLTLGNGMKNRIDITNYNANHSFSDSEFVFNPNNHPNVEIVDLR